MSIEIRNGKEVLAGTGQFVESVEIPGKHKILQTYYDPAIEKVVVVKDDNQGD